MNGNSPTNGTSSGTALRTLRERAGEIRSREEFVQFTRTLVANLRENPDDWTNTDLAGYLEALGAWVEDMDGYYQNRGEPVPEQPTWKSLGEILCAAKVYE